MPPNTLKTPLLVCGQPPAGNLNQYLINGAEGLKNLKPGPKGNYRRTDEVIRQIIRYRFLDSALSPEVIAQKLNQLGFFIAIRSVERVISEYGLQKKLHLCRPGSEPLKVETHRTKQKVRLEISDPPALERGVRQLLANKISGTMAGLWLLIPEYLRLGTWDLLKAWTGRPDQRVEPRLALQLINESALCLNGLRLKRSLNQRGYPGPS